MRRIAFTRKTLLLTLLFVVLLTGGGVFAYSRVRNDEQPHNAPETVNTSASQAERDQAEQREAEQHKDDLVKKEQQPQPAPGQKRQVTVVVTNASAQSVNAYVAGVFEEGGTCTATFTKESQTVTKTSQGFQNVSTTNCAPFAIQRTDFPSAGTWSLTVGYTSPAAEGKSAAQNVEVH